MEQRDGNCHKMSSQPPCATSKRPLKPAPATHAAHSLWLPGGAWQVTGCVTQIGLADFGRTLRVSLPCCSEQGAWNWVVVNCCDGCRKMSQRAENGGLDPSWLNLAFLGRPDSQFRGPQNPSKQIFWDLWTENRGAPKTPNSTTTDPTPHSRPSECRDVIPFRRSPFGFRRMSSNP